jgi:methylmalonyl-CoA mutase, N-terminal domain
MVAAIERSYPQREIAEASYRYQQALDKKEKIMVGVNDFISEEKPLETLQIDETVAHRQAARLKRLRAERSQSAVERNLHALKKAAETYNKSATSTKPSSANGALHHENLMPHIYNAVKAYATLGEICDGLRSVFGTYEETAIT